jgi:hypothetical protein
MSLAKPTGRNDILSKTTQGINMSNPNAAGRGSKFKGVGQIGYKNYFEKSDPYAEALKFGKKVDYGNMMTSEELMHEHLK